MKKLLTLVIVFSSLITARAQNTQYHKMMEKHIAALDSGKSYGSYLALAGVFERIGNAEKKEWLPFYHAAYSYVIASYGQKDNDKKDEYLDKAQELADKAENLQPNEPEIILLKSFILSARIPVNPMVRGMKYGPESGAMLETAYAMDKENPRYYFLKGSGLFYTPEMFGGGKEKALPVLEKAKEKYETFKPKSSIHPNWGQKQALGMLQQCKE